jgi:DNA replication protein DnaC
VKAFERADLVMFRRYEAVLLLSTEILLTRPGATLITSNLPFDEWTETFGTERLTGALLDRLTHHVNILEMNGESYRLAQSRARKTGDNT